jgi:hypothetical protein
MDLPAPLAWLVDEASASTGPDRFLAELGSRLLADGLPLAGGALGARGPASDHRASHLSVAGGDRRGDRYPIDFDPHLVPELTNP